MTFTIMGRCKQTGAMGICTTSFSPVAGSRVPAARSRRGMAAIMSHASPPLVLYANQLFDRGCIAPYVLEELRKNDPFPEYRQIGVIDVYGNAVADTGSKAIAWASHIVGDGFISLGNVVVSERVVSAMAEAYAAVTDQSLEQRLLAGLEAGRDAGGQPEGQTSAFILVYHPDYEYSFIDLRVDLHEEPVGELRRIFEWYQPLVAYYAQKGRDPRMPRYHEWARDRAGATQFIPGTLEAMRSA